MPTKDRTLGFGLGTCAVLDYMYDAIPTSISADDDMTSVRLPSDVVDELTVATLWLSLQLGHRVPLPQLRRALIRGGLAQVGRVLSDLRGDLALE